METTPDLISAVDFLNSIVSDSLNMNVALIIDYFNERVFRLQQIFEQIHCPYLFTGDMSLPLRNIRSEIRLPSGAYFLTGPSIFPLR